LIHLADNKDEMITQLSAENEALKEQLKKANNKIIWFEEQVKLARHRKFGKQTEQTQSLQTILPLFDDNQSDEVTETETPISAEKIRVTYEREKKKKTNGRNIDTTHLPREQIIHDLTETEKTCICGCQLTKIGEDKSEQLELIPAQIKVIEHITPKYTCRDCETIKSAKKTNPPIQKCMAGASLIVDVIIKKYDHHLPLYRQSKILLQNGIDIPDNTLGNWVMGAADVLFPLEQAFWMQLIQSRYLQADETTVKILYPDKKGYIWAYHSLDPKNRFILFEFNLTRSGSVPENRLKGFRGILQTDGYAGYERVGNQENIIRIGCWDHARRKFTDTIKVSGNKTGLAHKCLRLINLLYDIERDIKEATPEVRYETRQKKSKPILNKLFNLANTIKALPKSTLGTAITYLKNNERYLLQYIEDGRMQISNILIENQMRPFAIGRKNWLFVGNESSANKSAFLYSLIQSCKLNKIDFRKYLIYVLNNAHAMRRGDIDLKSLLPQFINPEILA
jgi:transposase